MKKHSPGSRGLLARVWLWRTLRKSLVDIILKWYVQAGLLSISRPDWVCMKAAGRGWMRESLRHLDYVGDLRRRYF
jgi:hypothetical protein